MNFIGLFTLYKKEVMRTRDVILQAVLSPVIMTVLYFIVFGTAMGDQINPAIGVTYEQFIVPGLIMMALIMNSLMASSSGIYFPRFVGSFAYLLSAPLSFLEIVLGYALAATTRALFIGLLIYGSALFFTPIPIAHPLYTLLFAFLCAFSFALLGLIIGIYSKDFEQLSFVPSLLIMPLSFLGGIFYSLDMLSDFWRNVSLINPIFYMIDGLRYGFFNASYASPSLSLLFILLFTWICFEILRWIFKTGYKLRS